MQYESINTADELQEFCNSLSDEPVIAFDTEFVSDDTYRPQLCLIQVATPKTLAIIDPLRVENTIPFWDLLASSGRTV
ncbi:ribonuclease D, partial [Rhodopirellula sp.]|nr:ribonuclease D [Rhodopirellula sp.]